MRNLENRQYIMMVIFAIIALIFILRLLYIQVIDESYRLSARNQSLQYITQYPVRGVLVDRHGKHLVYNEAAYDLMVIPRKVKDLDSARFCTLTGLELTELRQKLKEAVDYSRYKSSVVISQIRSEDYAPIAEHLYLFPGFYGQERPVRAYPEKIAAHALGYMGEISQRQLNDTAVINADAYYKPRDYLGISGLEQHYEHQLRGKKGVRIFMRDVHNVIQAPYKNGYYDTLPTDGMNLVSSLDAALQHYGEKLMSGKIGSIVAIEPGSGEILAMVSAPGYDPNMLVGRDRGKHYKLLSADSLDPLFNRATMAQYPPGSIFKVLQALVALQEGVVTPGTGFICNKALVNCHNHASARNITEAIKYSCNPYFYQLDQRLIQRGNSKSIFKNCRSGLAIWEDYMHRFGLGQRLAIDINGVQPGNIPGPDYYDRIYGKYRWAYSTIYSISIGQGEVMVVPVQMANIACIIANRGYYYTPHLVKNVGMEGPLEVYRTKHETGIDTAYYSLAIEAMRQVVNVSGGTARRARIDGITVCGKTGTAQNPHGEDHSVFIAFAPMEHPGIAIAVYVENAGFGGTWAAPIASLMIEKYLRDSISDKTKEKRILDADFIHKTNIGL